MLDRCGKKGDSLALFNLHTRLVPKDKMLLRAAEGCLMDES